MDATEEELGALARTLRRNNVAVDLVNICEESNTEKLAKVTQQTHIFNFYKYKNLQHLQTSLI